MGKLSKSQSCLHFALQQEQQQTQAGDEGDTAAILQVPKFRTRTTALHLPCGSAFLKLPRIDSTPADLNLYLQSHPQLAQRAKELHHQSSQISLEERFSPSRTGDTQQRSSTTTCINVLQGEMAHATDQQGVDVLLSAEATTCHILAVRSTSCSTATARRPLTTLAHLDECHPICMETIVHEHIAHHQASSSNKGSKNITAKLEPLGEHHDEHDDDFGFFDTAQEETDFLLLPPPPPTLHSSWTTPTSTSPTDTSHFPGFLVLPQPSSSSSSSNDAVQPTTNQSHIRIQMELHLVGGCNDPDGTSHRLSKDLLETWAHLAEQYRTQIVMCVQTMAISGLNTTNNSPANGAAMVGIQARGMGIDTRTGAVFSIVDPKGLPGYLEGPALEIRQARLWARAIQEANSSSRSSHHQAASSSSSSFHENNKNDTPRLSIIHNRHSRPGELTIEPFDYQPHPHLESLLAVKDDSLLLHATSTSPDLESEQFCTTLRRTLSFLQRVPSSHVFGAETATTTSTTTTTTTTSSSTMAQDQPQQPIRAPKPLVYARSTGNLHEWEPVADTDTSGAVPRNYGGGHCNFLQKYQHHSMANLSVHPCPRQEPL